MNTPKGFFTYRPLLEATAARYGYDAALLAAQAHQESAFQPGAVSSAGARGLMQFMPATWRELGRGKDIHDPASSLDAGVRYMVGLLNQFGDVRMALAAYNCGAGNLTKAAKRAGSWAWEKLSAMLPLETQRYVPAILTLREGYATAHGLAKAALAKITPTVTAPVAAIPGAVVAVMALLGVLVVRRFA